MGALDAAVRAGKARYVGISSYGPKRTEEAARILRELGTPLLIHQPSYSLLNRWIEQELLDVLEREGVGAIVFSPLAQGLLTDQYLDGVPEDSRVRRGNYFSARAAQRAEPRSACARSTRSPRGAGSRSRRWRSPGRCATSASPRRCSAPAACTSSSRTSPRWSTPTSTSEELAEIDRHAQEGGIDLWAESSSA